MTQYEEDIQKLRKQLNEAKEDEKKRKDELEKQMVQFSFCLFLVCMIPKNSFQTTFERFNFEL